MKKIIAKTANELFIKTAKQLLLNGNKVTVRGLKTIELEDVFLILKDSSSSFVTLKERKASKEYLEQELKWYDSMNLNINEISKYSSFWKTIADENNNVQSNYGKLIYFHEPGKDSQYEWCKKQLLNDIHTRQAIINYNQPIHKINGTKDFVCTIAQLFRYNDKTKSLDSTVLMRSNDFIYGLTYDMPWFTLIQNRLAKDINVKQGEYKHYAASLHVYEKHFKMLQEIANAKNN